MKRVIVLLAAFFAAQSGLVFAADRPGGLGLGVVVGDPTGFTGKYWMTPVHALDFGIGGDEGDFQLYGDYLWHGWRAFPQPSRGQLAAYLGLGAGVQTAHDTILNLRTVAGVSYWFDTYPVEVFFELVPTFRITPDSGGELNAGLGLRYYFKAFN